MTRIEQINDKIQTLIEDAEKMFKFKMPYVEVRFDLRGRSAGQALRKGSDYSMRFNIDMINNSGFDHILNDTVPHELAHIICMYRNIDTGHGKIWRNICVFLGGSGERCHSEEVIPARVTEKFVYTATCGTKLTVSKIRHNKIQKGVGYTLKSTGGKIIPQSWVKLAV